MTYDSDKTSRIMAELREAVRSESYAAAAQLLRHADAGGCLRGDAAVLDHLAVAVGRKHADRIVAVLAADECRYCSGGRDRCEECDGRGQILAGKVCPECAGLGVCRCPFCNGTGFAGYDFVPRGLRRAVLAQRLAFAERFLTERIPDHSSNEPDSPSELARRMLDIDRCRGVLANAVEQARLLSGTGIGNSRLMSGSERVRVERLCRKANGRAEAALRRLLGELAGAYADKAQRTSRDDHRRTLYAHRAKTFVNLSRSSRFEGSALRTPASLLRADDDP